MKLIGVARNSTEAISVIGAQEIYEKIGVVMTVNDGKDITVIIEEENENEINIKIEGLNQLTESLALIGSALAYKNNMVKTSAEAVDLLLDVTDKIEDFTEEEKVKKDVVETVVSGVVQAPEVKEVETAETPAITIEEIREVFVAKNNIKGNTPKLKAILTEFGVNKVTDLEEKDFEAVLNKLKEI